jgi:CTD nuclear envelope phosphatase 1
MNVLAHINTPPPSPARSRTPSISNILHVQLQPRPTAPQQEKDADADVIASENNTGSMVNRRGDAVTHTRADATEAEFDEKTPLLSSSSAPLAEPQPSRRRLLPQRIAGAFVSGLTLLAWPFVTVGSYVVACFYHSDGRFSLVAPVYHIAHSLTRSRRKKKPTEATRTSTWSNDDEKGRRKSRRLSSVQSKGRRPMQRSPSIASNSTAMTSDSESERPPTRDEDYDTPSRHTRSKSTASSVAEEIAPAKRQIRIKLHNEEALRQRKVAKKTSHGLQGSGQVSAEAANALKSPIGPIASKQLTKFPRAPQPPRPLVPRRQPSYSASGASAVGPHQKTLILDLDETLIHSMAKGGRYTTGHMVEVKLQQPVGAGGQIIGTQVPILYYVHKRPHCDEFLKKVRARTEYLSGRPLIADLRCANGTIWSSSPRRCKSTRIPSSTGWRRSASISRAGTTGSTAHSAMGLTSRTWHKLSLISAES